MGIFIIFFVKLSMMSLEKNLINMLYILLVLVFIISQGESHPNINHMHEGRYGYNPYEGIDPREIQNGHEQFEFTPTPERRFSTYVPLIDGRPIYIPDMQTDLRVLEEHNIPRTSWRRTAETFSNRRSPGKRQHPIRTRNPDFSMRPFGTRRRKHVFQERPQVDFETAVMESFVGEHGEVSDSFTKKEKPNTHKKPSIHVKHEKPVHVLPEVKYYPDIEDEYDHPVVVEALTKKDKPVTHKKPSIHIKPEEIVIPDYKGYHPEIVIEDAFDHPVVVEALTKKDKPVTHVKPPKHKPQKPEIVVPEYKEYPDFEEYDQPIVIEALTKKEKPVTHKKPIIHTKPEEPEEIVIPEEYGPEIIIEDDYDHPVVVEALTKKDNRKKDKPVTHVKPPKHKPEKPEIVVPEYKEYPDFEEYDHPVVVEALTKKEKPVAHKKPIIHTKPEEPEEIVVPEEYNHEIIIEDDYDHPVVVEALTKKDKPKKDKPVTHVKPPKPEKPEIVVPEYKEYPDFIVEEERDHPVVVDLTKKDKPKKTISPEHVLDKRDFHHEDDEDGEQPETPRIQVTDKDTVSLDQARSLFGLNGLDGGSGSIPEDIISRSFLPVDPNILSLMSDFHAQERQNFKRCLTSKKETGNCMPIQLCSVSSVVGTLEDLLNNVCTIDEVLIGICCPEFPVDTVRVDWDKFEEKHNSENVSDSEMAKECGKLPTSVNKTVSWPWTAPLVAVSTGKEFCGGALITEQYALSAAHCTNKIPLNRILVRLGPLNRDGKSEDFEVVEIKRHAQYNSRTLQNDIALLKLSRKVKLGDFRRLICLPDDKDYAGETSILLGPFEFTKEKEELESLRVISNQECTDKMGVFVGDSFLCTMPRKEDNKCNDDSGAPLVVGQGNKFKIVGVLTWSRNDCDGRFPSKFTRVSKYKKWIENHAV